MKKPRKRILLIMSESTCAAFTAWLKQRGAYEVRVLGLGRREAEKSETKREVDHGTDD